MMQSTPRFSAARFSEIDDEHISKAQWGIVLISGMGFFTDAYDLFIIGVVLKLLKSDWHIGSLEMAVVGATALVSAAIGSAVFGRIADVFGRKYIYGFEVLVLGAGAIASAFSPNIWWLIVFRFVLGLGIGGDYPVSATIASEFAGKKTRGLMISSVFAMQGVGLIVGPLLAIALLSAHVPQDLVWRILLAAGAVPPLAVFWARRHLKETPRFAQMTEGKDDAVAEKAKRIGFVQALKDAFGKDRQLAKWLVGTSLAWFLLDLAYYGNTISNQQFVSAVSPGGSQIHDLYLSLAVFAFAAFPGYLLAIFGMERWGRKTIQLLGFAMMAASFIGIAFIGDAKAILVPFVALYCLNYFFTEFGPNTTTFVLPAEIFPMSVRTTSHGISATVGKVGAAVGTFSFPLLEAKFGLPGPMWVAGACCLGGLATTWALLPEPKGLDLEEASRDRSFSEGSLQPAV
ncbi:MAG: MFS transporter [Candidatus Eremiobacteraeota bacterium]|nr:MFS transporter [Candidatus Eremiobacteraeota bacterium]